MEIEIVAEEDVEAKPAGLGRDEPNMNPVLDPPKWALFYLLLLMHILQIFNIFNHLCEQYFKTLREL